MPNLSDTDHAMTAATTRIEALECHLAFLEDQVSSLNDVIVRQDRLLADLQRQLQLLYEKVHQPQTELEPFNVLSDRPPHY